MLEKNFEKIKSENCILYKNNNSSLEEFMLVQSKIETANFIKSAQNKLGDAEFVTYTNDIKTLNVSYKRKCKTLRIIEEEGVNLPLEEYEDNGFDVLVTQLKTTYFSYDCGMGYIIRLSNGKFVLIDGGMAEYDEPQRFIDTLNSQNEFDSVPVIAAWFITHPHTDHFNLLIRAVSEFSDKFILENVVCNFSDSDYSSTGSDLSEFNKIIEIIGKDKIKIARTGQKYVFGNDYLEIVYCADDFYPNFAYINDTSLVIKGLFNGKSIMWLADVEKYGSDMIANEYSTSYLKSDVMQVGHHGFGGASVQLHRIIDPTWLFWPSPDYWYIEKIKLDINDHLRNSSKIKETFIADREQTVLNMSDERFCFIGNEGYKALKLGDAIVNEDFKKKSICSTGFRCICGGDTGFEAVKAEFVDGGLELSSIVQNAITVLELASPWQTEYAQSIIIKLSVRVNDTEELSLLYNDPTPTQYSESKIIDLPTDSGEYDICLRADADLGRKEIFVNGDLLLEKIYAPAELRGVYLVLKNADIILKNVKITKA